LDLSPIEGRKGERRRKMDKMGKVKYLGGRWSAGPERFCRIFRISSVEKVSQPTISQQTYREE
jgi:hypothetical protein